jgi:hypothetical protein
MFKNKYVEFVWHWARTALLFAIPLFISHEPMIANLTIGGLLNACANWAEGTSAI